MQHRAGSSDSATTATGVDDAALTGLRRWNLGLGVLHAVQAVAVLVLATDFAISVIASYAQGPPGTELAEPETVVDVRIGWAIAAFLLLAAIDHVATATVVRRRYEADLRRGLNAFRWVEYSVSATIMIVLIAFYNGIVEVSAVFGIIGANVAMILFGWLQELMNPPGRATTTMLPFWFGCVAGAAPWVAITWNLVAAREDVPGFVFGIFVSLFVFFMSFGVNQWLQYRQVGPWRSYAFGERAYLVLSLVAKSALAWQIFAGSLV
ncbi:heliorhodopsin HeR [Nocardioides sp. C4-1]|uniref:heliorhodopsin HeR n=1 Tax=Nocardioides sp. C4-1 TaxID=3151851 RepID=UPI0032638131